MSDQARGYPHKQEFCLSKERIRKNNKRNAWYREGKSRVITPKKKED